MNYQIRNYCFKFTIMEFNEIWLPIKGYEDLYEVSNFGRIKSLPKTVVYSNGRFYTYEDKILKRNNSNGYLTVSLVKNKVKKTFMIHSLVAIMFIENPSIKPFVNHKDGIRWNNYFKNLEWSTNSENQLHSYNVLGNKAVRGVNNGASKLNDDQVSSIREQYRMLGLTQKEIADIYKVSASAIGKIVRDAVWRMTT